MRRIVLFLLAAFFLLPSFSVGAAANESLESEYSDFFSDLPNSVKDKLPDSVGGSDAASDAEALTDWRYFLSATAEVLGAGISRVLPMLAALCGLLILSAALSAFRSALSPKLSEMLSFCTSCAVGAAAIALQYETLRGASEYLTDLCALANLLFPLTVSLYAAGGNISAAGVSAGAFGIFLNICENLLIKTVLPFCGICLSLALAGSFSSHVELSPLATTIKKTYTTALGFLSTVFLFVLGSQSAIASGQDSLSLRAVKFVAGSAIPVLGGAVGESTKTFFAGIGMLRKSIGVTGIFLILLLFLPTLISLLLVRTVNGIASGFAALLGCRRESTLLSEISGIYGYLCAVLCMSSLMLVFLLTLLINTAAVGAGG